MRIKATEKPEKTEKTEDKITTGPRRTVTLKKMVTTKKTNKKTNHMMNKSEREKDDKADG